MTTFTRTDAGFRAESPLFGGAKGKVSGRYVAGLLGGAVGLGVGYVVASIFRFIA